MLPHRITTLVEARVVEELVFSDIRVNQGLTPRDFTRQTTLNPPGR